MENPNTVKRVPKILTEKILIKPEGTGLIEGKIAIITGGTQGIGLASVARFVEEGATVVFTGRQDDLGLANARFLTECGGECTYYHCDALDREQVKNVVQKVIEKYGRIDILVNNAGQNITERFDDATPEQFRQMVRIHGLGHCYMLWEILPIMEKQGGGVVVEVGSKSSVKAAIRDPFYCFAKAGVAQLAKCLNLEYGKSNIRINMLAPGLVYSGMTTKKDGVPFDEVTRMKDFNCRGYIAYPEEMAKSVVWLASDEADYISGQIICSDGGLVT